MTKQELREQIKAKINRIKADDRDTASLYICLKIIGTKEWQEANTVLLYTALPDEVDLGLLIQDANDSGKTILLPLPTANAPALPTEQLNKVDLAIIPGRAFTLKGDRMGRGKGYYDRLLKDLNCPKWGAAFSCQIVKEIQTDTWDVMLDKIIDS